MAKREKTRTYSIKLFDLMVLYNSFQQTHLWFLISNHIKIWIKMTKYDKEKIYRDNDL